MFTYILEYIYYSDQLTVIYPPKTENVYFYYGFVVCRTSHSQDTNYLHHVGCLLFGILNIYSGSGYLHM